MVRRVIGYDRYTSKSAFDCLDRIYSLLRLYMNFFQPTMKLLSKSRYGAKVYKVYDIAQTPYQRLLKLGMLSQSKQTELAAIYRGLNPVLLLKQINGNLEKLWSLADRRDLSHPESTGRSPAWLDRLAKCPPLGKLPRWCVHLISTAPGRDGGRAKQIKH